MDDLDALLRTLRAHGVTRFVRRRVPDEDMVEVEMLATPPRELNEAPAAVAVAPYPDPKPGEQTPSLPIEEQMERQVAGLFAHEDFGA